ncbi:MAG: hypothetical protein ACI4TK_00750 [Agathobacter sp.]
MKTKKVQLPKTVLLIGYLGIVILIIGLLALIPKVFSINDMLYQTTAVVLSVVFSAIVTSTLLTGQSTNEESREKNIKIHTNKITVYSEFVSQMWKLVERPSEDSVKELRKLLFSKPVFMIDPDSLKKIAGQIEHCDINDENVWKTLCSNITSTLRKELIEEKGEEYNDFGALWNAFDRDIDEGVTQISDNQISSENSKPATNDVISRRVSTPCFHFNILNQNWQYKLFSREVNALYLCEYGEEWRTNLIKRCKNNEIVFLYRTGGPGYVGVFRAKGWVVFESEGDRKISREEKWVFNESDKPIIIDNEQQLKKDSEFYEATFDDGETRISYLIVEPLIFTEKGVGNISVYRRTISAYYTEYAWRTLGRFKSRFEDNQDDTLNTISYNGEKIKLTVNENALKQIFSENNIQSSTWEQGKGWIDK